MDGTVEGRPEADDSSGTETDEETKEFLQKVTASVGRALALLILQSAYSMQL